MVTRRMFLSKRRELPVVLSLVFALVLMSCSLVFQISFAQTPTTTPTIQWKTIRNAALGMSFELPNNWTNTKQMQTKDVMTLLTVDPKQTQAFSASLVLSNQSKALGTIEQFSKSAVNKTSSSPSFKMVQPLDFSKYTISGEKAGTYIYTNKLTLHITETQAILTIHNGKHYLFIYSAFPPQFDSPEQKALRDHIFKSIKWMS
jgi:hypothetical protein